jgi:ankyrin repeat protein
MSQRIDRNYPPLIKAILANDAQGARQILAAGADPNAMVHKVTPLGFALDGFRCAPDVIRTLAEAGADLEALIWPSDISPLHLALNRSNTPCAQVLLEFGADFRRPDRLGGTSIHAAAHGGLLDMMNLFAEGGVDINAVTTTGWTAMMFAALNGDERMIRRMLELGADPCVREPNGRSVADFARGAGLAELSRELQDVCKRRGKD